VRGVNAGLKGYGRKPPGLLNTVNLYGRNTRGRTLLHHSG